MSSYHIQGAVPLESPAYIPRGFEGEIIENIMSNRWVLLLGPRQHGKTTSLIRVQENLNNNGTFAILVDLQALPLIETYEDIISSFYLRLSNAVGFDINGLPEGYQAHQMDTCLKLIFSEIKNPVVILIDEAGGITNNDYRNAFFGQIRAISNQKGTETPGSLLRRLNFVFAGSFIPELLVNDNNSPFNVCETVYTEDLTLDEAISLQSGIEGDENTDYVRQAFELVGGHPYLLQFILDRVSSVSELDKGAVYDEAVTLLKNGHNNHFDSVFSRIIEDPELIDMVSNIASGGSLPIEPGNYRFAYLQVLGIAKKEGDVNLVFRNSLYREFVENSSQLMGIDIPVANPSPLVESEESSFDFMLDANLKEISFSLETGAIRAHNSNNFRLSLVGFGAALEGILIDYLSSIENDVLDSAETSAQVLEGFNQSEMPRRPETWRFATLLNVTNNVDASVRIINPSQSLRTWRNYIHPGVVIQDYIPEGELGPESGQALHMLAQVKRDLSRRQ
jgi:hypothetical protein